jgi:DNA-binding NtrC family response regulator
MHDSGPLRRVPFVTVVGTALRESDAELVRSAGREGNATDAGPGLLEQAAGGTLF